MAQSAKVKNISELMNNFAREEDEDVPEYGTSGLEET